MSIPRQFESVSIRGLQNLYVIGELTHLTQTSICANSVSIPVALAFGFQGGELTDDFGGFGLVHGDAGVGMSIFVRGIISRD